MIHWLHADDKFITIILFKVCYMITRVSIVSISAGYGKKCTANQQNDHMTSSNQRKSTSSVATLSLFFYLRCFLSFFEA